MHIWIKTVRRMGGLYERPHATVTIAPYASQMISLSGEAERVGQASRLGNRGSGAAERAAARGAVSFDSHLATGPAGPRRPEAFEEAAMFGGGEGGRGRVGRGILSDGQQSRDNKRLNALSRAGARIFLLQETFKC